MRFLLITASLLLFSARTTSAQSSEMKTLKLAVDTLFFVDKPEGLLRSTKGLELATAKNDTFYMSYFLDQAGELNRQQGNFDLAIEQLQECLRVKLGWEDLKDLSLTHNNLGKTYYNKGQYDLAIEQFIQALKLMELSQNKMGRAFYLSNIASTYDVQKNYGKAMDYYQRSLKLKIELGDSAAFASIYHNLGILSFNLNDLEESNSYLLKSLEINRALGKSDKIVQTQSNLGRNYIERKEFNKAEEILLEAYATCQRESSIEENNESHLIMNIGLLYERLGDSEKALKYNQEAIQLASSTGANEILRDAYSCRSILEEKLGNLSEALSFERLSSLYSDSLINEATIDAVAEMEAKYEYHKNKQLLQQQELEIAKEKQISAEAKLTRNYWIIGGIIFGFFSIFFGVKYINRRRQARLVSAQNELIKHRNTELDGMNTRMNTELEKLQVTVDTKQKILDEVFVQRRAKVLPSELLSLSKREMEVLSILALGWSDQEISNGLFISKTTTKTHLRRIYSKLLVKGRAEAVSLAHRHGIIGIGEQTAAS